MISVTAVIVAYGDEPWLEDSVRSVLASTDVDVDVVVVDNGDTSGVLPRLSQLKNVTVLQPGANTGFAAGCNTGAESAAGDVIALVNPDVVVEACALGRLAEVACEPGIGIATASLRLADEPQLLNSTGNPVHYLGLAWAGAFREPASRHELRVPVASASGACCAIRASVWRELGGFEPAYFAYHEDVELSLRCWQRGLDVVYVPDAAAWHRYEFSRNDLKTYLLERNRWFTLLTIYSARTLLLLAPALAVLELALLAAATVQGWLPAKLRGYRWLIGHRSAIQARRREVQASRLRTDRELAHLFTARFEPANLPTAPGMGILNIGLATYWRLVRRAL